MPILVVGGTGHVGRQVVAALLQQGQSVRLLVRPGSDAPEGIEVVRGDMMDPASLDPAFVGVQTVISCAAGYTRRKSGDTLEIDMIGNQNLAQAAKRAGVKRYVLCSILCCDLAKDVPHFVAKAKAEQALRDAGVPFVSLRPGAFLDQAKDFMADNVRKDKFMALGDAKDTRWTYVYTADLAQSLVKAALTDKPVEGRVIDVGWSTGPVSNQELHDAIAAQTGRKLKFSTVPWAIMKIGLGVAGLISEGAGDMGAMFFYFKTGAYVATPTAHEELLGPLPTKDDAIKRWATAKSLLA